MAWSDFKSWWDSTEKPKTIRKDGDSFPGERESEDESDWRQIAADSLAAAGAGLSQFQGAEAPSAEVSAPPARAFQFNAPRQLGLQPLVPVGPDDPFNLDELIRRLYGGTNDGPRTRS